MIIAPYFFLFHPGEYTVSKSESTLFRLEDNAFSCGRSVFVATATEVNLHAANFARLAFKTQIMASEGGK